MPQKIKNILLQTLPVIFLATFLTVLVIYAWSEPTSPPPSGNVSAPLNVGSVSQDKSGALRIGGIFQTDDAAFLARYGGNVGIGTPGPVGKLNVSGGAGNPVDDAAYAGYLVGKFQNTGQAYLEIRNTADQQAGLLLKGTGLTSSQHFLVGLNNNSKLRIGYGTGITDSKDGSSGLTIQTDGNVGIGTASPGAKLEVAGQVKITGGSPGAGKVLTDVTGSGLASWQTSSGGQIVLPTPISNSFTGEPNMRDNNIDTYAEGTSNWYSNDRTYAAVYDLGSEKSVTVTVDFVERDWGTWFSAHSWGTTYIDISHDNSNFYELASKQILNGYGGTRNQVFAVVQGRYLRIRALSHASTGGSISWAEIRIQEVRVK